MNTYTFRPHTRRFIAHVLRSEFAEAGELVAKYGYICSDRNRTGETALHWLAIEGEIEGVTLLLEHGADPNCETLSGASVLSDTASLGLCQIVQALLQAGADVNWRHHYNRESALHIAVRHANDSAIVDVLVDAGAEINARDHLDDTPLHQAAHFDNREIAARLLARGADPKAVNEWGDTVLDVLPREAREAWTSLVAFKGNKDSEG